MEINELKDLLITQIKDLYATEQNSLTTMLKIMEIAASPLLIKEISAHIKRTDKQVERLNRIGELLEIRLQGSEGVGINGLIEEGTKLMHDTKNPAANDAAAIAFMQKIQHYEIASYGTAREHAAVLKLTEIADLLEDSLEEEIEMDKNLTGVATKIVNKQATASTA